MLVQYKWEAPELDKIWKGLYRENSYIFPYSSREYNENILENIMKIFLSIKRSSRLLYFKKIIFLYITIIVMKPLR